MSIYLFVVCAFITIIKKVILTALPPPIFTPILKLLVVPVVGDIDAVKDM